MIGNTLVQLPSTPELTLLKGKGQAFLEAVKSVFSIDNLDQGQFVTSKDNLLYWLEPETYLVEGAMRPEPAIKAGIHVIPITDQFKRVKIIGSQGSFIASKIMPLDFFFNFPVGSATQTRLGDAHVMVARLAYDQMMIQMRRSFFDYVVAQVLQANRGLLHLDGLS